MIFKGLFVMNLYVTIALICNQYLKYIFCMRLTTFSDYALRTLVFLEIKTDKLANISEIAAVYGVSQNHLMKVVHFLAKRGYIDSLRGKGGGIRLKLKAEEINIGELIRATEGGNALIDCIDKGQACRIFPACNLIQIFRDAHAAFYAVLDQYTLADVAKNRNELSQILIVPIKK